MPKAALCSDVFAPASVAGCSNLYLLFTVVIGEGCGSSRSDSMPLCRHLNICENCFVYWEFPKAGVFDLQQSLLEQGEREHIPLFAVGEDICCCLTQTMFFFLSTRMLWLVLSAGGNSEQDEGSWQVWYFFLGFEGRPPVWLLFYQRCCVAEWGGLGYLGKSEEAVYGVHSPRNSHSKVKLHLWLLDLSETFDNLW